MSDINHDHYDVFIEGEVVDLIVLTEDISLNSNWYKWFNDKETTQNMQKHYFPNTAAQQLSFFKDSVIDSSKKLQLGINHKSDNTLIGVISLNEIDFINQKCEIAGLIGEKKYKSIGYWLEANRLIFKHAVNTLNMRRIYGGSLGREVSVFYERMLGFHQEGTRKQEIFKDGEFRDVYYFGRIFEGPLK
jgi:RimJ/RimL family protein N-acetyltransferase